MPRQMTDSDWRTFRQLQEIALERFCERVLKEIESIAADASKSCHRRYLDIFCLTEQRDKELARAFDNPRRSTALIQLSILRSSDLLTEEELARFSPDTRDALEVVLGLYRE